MVRREPGASPSSLLRVSIEAEFRDVLRRRGGAGIRDVLRGRGDETANFSSTLLQGSRCPLAAIRGSRRNRRRLGAGGPTDPGRLGPPTSGRLSGGVSHRPRLNCNRQGWGGGPHPPDPGARRQATGSPQQPPRPQRTWSRSGTAARRGGSPPQQREGRRPAQRRQRHPQAAEQQQAAAVAEGRRRPQEGGRAPPLAAPSCSRAPQWRQKP
jgi:hypothetical protein